MMDERLEKALKFAKGTHSEIAVAVREITAAANFLRKDDNADRALPLIQNAKEILENVDTTGFTNRQVQGVKNSLLELDIVIGLIEEQRMLRAGLSLGNVADSLFNPFFSLRHGTGHDWMRSLI